MIRLELPGGGGHGDPRRREPALVAADVADALVTRESAEEDYGVTLPSGNAGD
jgi:N-methylhydantoinase B